MENFADVSDIETNTLNIQTLLNTCIRLIQNNEYLSMCDLENQLNVTFDFVDTDKYVSLRCLINSLQIKDFVNTETIDLEDLKELVQNCSAKTEIEGFKKMEKNAMGVIIAICVIVVILSIVFGVNYLMDKMDWKIKNKEINLL